MLQLQRQFDQKQQPKPVQKQAEQKQAKSPAQSLVDSQVLLNDSLKQQQQLFDQQIASLKQQLVEAQKQLRQEARQNQLYQEQVEQIAAETALMQTQLREQAQQAQTQQQKVQTENKQLKDQLGQI